MSPNEPPLSDDEIVKVAVAAAKQLSDAHEILLRSLVVTLCRRGALDDDGLFVFTNLAGTLASEEHGSDSVAARFIERFLRIVQTAVRLREPGGGRPPGQA